MLSLIRRNYYDRHELAPPLFWYCVFRIRAVFGAHKTPWSYTVRAVFMWAKLYSPRLNHGLGFEMFKTCFFWLKSVFLLISKIVKIHTRY